jgi:hypothetical protein
MNSEKCLIEQLRDQNHADFYSVKPTDLGDSLLVINLKVFNTMLKPVANGIDGINTLCSLCQATCISGIISYSNSEIRVERIGYQHDETGNEFIKVTDFIPQNITYQHRVCVLDDDDPEMTAHAISRYGCATRAININSSYTAGPNELQFLFDTIRHFGTYVFIGDKGFSMFLSGYELFEMCKEAGMFTIMLTGEESSSETQDIPKVFLKKPVPIEKLVLNFPGFVPQGNFSNS